MIGNILSTAGIALIALGLVAGGYSMAGLPMPQWLGLVVFIAAIIVIFDAVMQRNFGDDWTDDDQWGVW